MAKSGKIDEEKFNLAQEKYQLGDWRGSKEILDELHTALPDDEQVTSLLNAVNDRLQLERNTKQDEQISFGKRWGRTIAIFGLGAIGILLFVFIALDTAAQAEENARNLQATQSAALAAQYYFEAQSMLDQDRPSDALPYIESLETLEPHYPGLEELKAEADEQAGLEALYRNAMLEYEKQNFQETLGFLREINSIDPEFRDVAELLDRSERLAVYGDLGIAGQYLIDAENLLAGGLAEQDDLQLAQANLDSASRQGPNDSDIFKLRLSVLQSYLDALNGFLDGDVIGSIVDLEYFIENDGGTFDSLAYFMLQEAYYRQGIDASNDGHFTEALGSFLIADQVSNDGPEAPLYSIMINLQVASTIGEVGEFKDAADRYQELDRAFDMKSYLIKGSNPEAAFESALAAYEIGDFRTATLRFDSAFRDFFVLLPTEEIQVQQGESVINIAAQYRCPMNVLVELNDLDPSEVYLQTGMLLIPVLEN